MLKKLFNTLRLYFWAFKRHYISAREKLPLNQNLFNWKLSSLKRSSIINDLIRLNGYKKYLEIGCFDNRNFLSIEVPYKVGVDPISGGTHRMTSDEFFERNSEKFDIIFIDGLHLYEQVRKDLYHSLEALSSGGAIVIHDMLPSSWEQERVPRLSQLWNGTVWKVAYEAKSLFGDKFGIIRTDHGVGVIFFDIPTFGKEEISFGDKNYLDFVKDYHGFNVVPAEHASSFLSRRRYDTILANER